MAMIDMVYVGVAIAFFALTLAGVHGLDRL
jgi:hypothetical protein